MKMKLSPKAADVLASLRAHVEGISFLSSENGAKFGIVYLDNAKPAGMSRRSFAGYLSTLQKAGLYKSQGDDCFGDVKLEENDSRRE
jgi:hypothetical protein